MTDIFLKISSPSAGKPPVTQRIPCYFAASASLTNPLPDCSNYSPFCHTRYFILSWMNTSLVSWDRLFTKLLCWRLLHCYSAFTAESSRQLMSSGVPLCIEEAKQLAEASGDLPPPPLQIVISIPFCLFVFSLYLYPLSLFPFSILVFSLSSFPLVEDRITFST